MLNPKVSIIIPVFNCGGYLKACINDLLKQTYENKELIIVDDASTDSTYTVAKSFENSSIIVIKQKNAGAAAARNTGLNYSTGDFIQFMDVDDFISHNKIELQVKALLNEVPGKVAVCNYVRFSNDKELAAISKLSDQSSFIFSSNDPAKFLLNLWGAKGHSNFIQTNCWLVPRAVIEKSGGWRDYRCPDDDGEFFSRVLLASTGVVYTPGAVNYYRRPQGEYNLSGSINRKYLQNTLLTIDLKRAYLKGYEESAAFKRAFATQYLDFAVFNFPAQIVLSKIAEKRFKEFGVTVPMPVIGGKLLMLLASMFGWKAARLLRFYLKEKKK